MSERDDRALPLQVLDALHEGVVVVDALRAVVLMNPRAEALLGRRWSPGTCLADLFPEPASLAGARGGHRRGPGHQPGVLPQARGRGARGRRLAFHGRRLGHGGRDPALRHHRGVEGRAGAPAVRLHGGPRAEEPAVGHPQLPERHPHGHVRRRPREDPGHARALQDPRRGAARPGARPAVHQPARGGPGGPRSGGPRPLRRARRAGRLLLRADRAARHLREGALRGVAGDGARRPGRPRPRLHEPALQRDQVQPGRRDDRGADRGRGRWVDRGGRRLGPRHERCRARGALPGVLPGEERAHAPASPARGSVW